MRVHCGCGCRDETLDVASEEAAWRWAQARVDAWGRGGGCQRDHDGSLVAEHGFAVELVVRRSLRPELLS